MKDRIDMSRAHLPLDVTSAIVTHILALDNVDKASVLATGWPLAR